MQTERRRSPRVAVSDHRVGFRVSNRVRVIDISVGGALLSGPPYTEGMRGSLRVPLAPIAISCDVEIRQQQSLVGDAGLEVRAGVSFLNMSVETRRALDQLLAGANSK